MTLIPLLAYMMGNSIKSLRNVATSSIAACVDSATAVIKTDTNLFVKVLFILLMFISTMVATYFICVVYTTACTQIVTAVSYEDIPFFANIVAFVVIASFTLVFGPILIGLSRLSTIILPFATLLALGYEKEAYTCFKSVMGLEQNHGIRQAIED